MALLVGVSDTTSYTVTDESFGGGDVAWWPVAFTAAETGTATRLYLYLSSYWSAGGIKLCIWSSTGTLLASTAAITGGAPGWISGTISDVSITAATNYRIGFISDGYIRPYSDGTTYNVLSESDNYTTPGDLGSGTGQAKGRFAIYADGTIGGGTAKPKLMNSMLRRRRQG